MTSVFSFRAQYFNNNGDQGNLEALEHFSKQRFDKASIEGADFVLFGDASRAAMREFESELESFVPVLEQRLSRGLPTLLIGSCYEFFAPRVNGMPNLDYGQRVSEFREVDASEMKVKGYRNSEVLEQDLFIEGLFVGTTLFGPVLAKNLELTKRMAAGLGLELSVTNQQLQWIERL